MTSPSFSQTQLSHSVISTPKVRHTISVMVRKLGPICSYKNCKQRTRKGLITKPSYQKQMEKIITDFESQLISAFATDVGEMRTELSLRSWIASCLPLDDSLSWIPEGNWRVEYVAPGEEGADILIERLEGVV